MTLKPDLLSLKHMCFQVLAIQFFRRIQAENKSNRAFWAKLYVDARTHFYLKDWISLCELPKSVEEEMHDVVIAFGHFLFAISEFYETTVDLLDDVQLNVAYFDSVSVERNCAFFAIPHLFDAIVPSPRGGILEKETCLNLLQDGRIDSNIKYDLAEHFCIHDPEVSNNVTDYCEQLTGKTMYYPQTFQEAFEEGHYWLAKHCWSVMSEEDKYSLSDFVEQIFFSLFSYGGFLRENIYLLFELIIDCASMNKGKLSTLLLNMKNEEEFDCFGSILYGYFKYHASPIGGKTDKLLRLLEDLLPEETFHLVINALALHIIYRNMQFLYPTLVTCWERRSDEFKKSCSDQIRTIEFSRFRVGYEDFNIIYATRCLSLLQPFVIKDIGHDLMVPRNIALFFQNLYLWKQPLEALDNYIQLFDVSHAKVAMLKRQAMETAVGKKIIKDLLFQENRQQDAYHIVKHALATEDDLNQYFISLFQAENNLANSDSLLHSNFSSD